MSPLFGSGSGAPPQLPLRLYRATMKNGKTLTVVARSEMAATDAAFSQFNKFSGNWVGVETVELAEGYDIA
jgi:hypothetical protein